MRYAVKVRYHVDRVIMVDGRNGKTAALEALRIVSGFKDALEPQVVDIAYSRHLMDEGRQ